MSIIPQKCRIDIKVFFTEVEKICDRLGLTEKMSPFLSYIQKDTEDLFYTQDQDDFELNEHAERMFFQCLLGEIQSNEIITKYTSLDNLLRICNDNEIAMVSILGMNDSTECSYTDNYLKRKKRELPIRRADQYYLGAYAFITSFTLQHDNLTMWRLYGENARGISIDFKIKNDLKDNFFLAPVSYAESNGRHTELDLLTEMQNIIVNNKRFKYWDLLVWRYFFKSFDYSIEKEIRLLYAPLTSISGVTWFKTDIDIVAPLAKFCIDDLSSADKKNLHPIYPLQVCGITLGPQFGRTSDNENIIPIMLRNKRSWTDIFVPVRPSTIDNYRS